jgi:phosphomannomutase
MDDLPIMSVSGIRGTVGKSFTPLLVSRMAFLQTKLAGSGKMVVGRDTRPTGAMFARAAFRGIRAAGGVPIDLGIAPTPTICVAANELGASGGIIITASHNPIEYNGYKMVHGTGRLYRSAECEEVYGAYRSGKAPTEEILSGISDLPEMSLEAAAIHLKRILAQIDVDLVRSAGIRVAVDSINGAGGAVFPALLEALGVKWIGVHNKLDGDFTHNPEPRPEHLTDLALLLEKNPDVWAGFAFDPDADRLATMGDRGTPITEEMTLVFCLQNILSRKKSDVATNLSTSMLIDDVAIRFGVNVFRTRIGEANVVEGMTRHNCSVGGEGNGGLIFPVISNARDGLAAIAVIIELMAKKNKKLSAIAAEWPVYANAKEKIPVGKLDPTAVIARLADVFSNEATDRLEGLKIIRDTGWVHIRASNTEPIIRCYAEARTGKEAQDLANMVLKALQTVAQQS